MNKNWLIRTKNNHILGPVSREKIKELLENGSIKGDDEICSGNGYWIHVREEDLLQKYLYQEKLQCFNPVQEAFSTKITQFPPDYDLLVGRVESNIAPHNQVGQTLIQENPLLPKEETLYDKQEAKSPTDITDGEVETKEKKKTKRVIKRRKSYTETIRREKNKSRLTYNVMIIIVIALLLIVVGSILNKNNLLSGLKSLVQTAILPGEAHAQVVEVEKKNSGFQLRRSLATLVSFSSN